MVVHNPTILIEKKQQDPDVADDFLKKLNAGEELSPLRCSKPYTLVVKVYQGLAVMEAPEKPGVMRQFGQAIDRCCAPARHAHAPDFGFRHHGVGGHARDDEDRQTGRMVGAFDERQPGDDFRGAVEFQRGPPRARAGDGEGGNEP